MSVPSPAGLSCGQTHSRRRAPCRPASKACSPVGDVLELAVGAREQDGDLRVEDLVHVLRGDARAGCAVARVRGELAAHGVEARRAPLALRALVGLVADALREVADDDRDDEHDGERDDVLQVGDGEAEVRRDEEEVERAAR